MRASFSSLIVAASLCLFAAAVAPLAVEARGLAATVYLTQYKVPKAGTEQQLLSFVKSHGGGRSWPKLTETTSETNLDERKFKATMVTKFSAPPGDLEFHVLFYDIHDGARRFVQDMSTFIDDRKQSTFVQEISLSRKHFKPNRKMELVITVRRAEVGSLKFTTDGEEKRNSGVVDFGSDAK
jgi:hypothetical protein